MKTEIKEQENSLDNCLEKTPGRKEAEGVEQAVARKDLAPAAAGLAAVEILTLLETLNTHAMAEVGRARHAVRYAARGLLGRCLGRGGGGVLGTAHIDLVRVQRWYGVSRIRAFVFTDPFSLTPCVSTIASCNSI
jgi:hypothetical protein